MSNTIKTLKTAKAGDKVTMLTFTGMNLGQFEIAKASKTKLAITKKNGDTAEFSRETGIQTNAANEKYANKIVDPIPVEKKEAPAKKAVKAVKVELEVEAEAEEEKPAKKTTKATKPGAKKSTKKVEKVEIEEDAEEFDDEADLDDDFEEFDED